jgi:hypothetical protein
MLPAILELAASPVVKAPEVGKFSWPIFSSKLISFINESIKAVWSLPSVDLFSEGLHATIIEKAAAEIMVVSDLVIILFTF